MGIVQSQSILESKLRTIYAAIKGDNSDNVKMVLSSVTSDEARQLISYRDAGGNNLLHESCRAKSYSCALFFIESGLPISDPNRDLITPLHYAVFYRSVRLVELLIQRGANTTSLTKEGKTALDIAQEKGFVEIVRIIESLISFFCGYIEKRSNTGLMGMLNNYTNKWIVIMNKNNGDSYPEGGRLIYYDSNTSAQPKKVYPLYGAKLYFEDAPEALSVTLTTLFSEGRLKLRAQNREQFKQLVNALTGQHQLSTSTPTTTTSTTSSRSSIPAAIPLGPGPPIPPRSNSMTNTRSVPVASLYVAPNATKPTPVIETPKPKVVLTPEELAKEIEKYGGECSICMDAAQNSVLVPCGHNGCCLDCASVLVTGKQPCPICRQPILQAIKFFPVGHS